MGQNTRIQWATHSWNPWRGCDRVPGAAECLNCYAASMAKRSPALLGTWGSESGEGVRVVGVPDYWDKPSKWNSHAALREQALNEIRKRGPLVHDQLAKLLGKSQRVAHELVEFMHAEGCVRPLLPGMGIYGGVELVGTPVRPRVFTLSMGDMFEDWGGAMVDVNGERLMFNETHGVGLWEGMGEYARLATMDDMRSRVFREIDRCQFMLWLVLTKRPQNIARLWPDFTPGGGGSVVDAIYDGISVRRPNVWLGTSAGTFDSMSKFAGPLLECRHKCAATFVSVEPMLERVTLPRFDASGRDVSGLPGLWDDDDRLPDWIIIGCESNGQRVGNLGEFKSEAAWWEHAARLASECRAAGVACFVKQGPVDGKVVHYADDFPRIAFWPREFPAVANLW